MSEYRSYKVVARVGEPLSELDHDGVLEELTFAGADVERDGDDLVVTYEASGNVDASHHVRSLLDALDDAGLEAEALEITATRAEGATGCLPEMRPPAPPSVKKPCAAALDSEAPELGRTYAEIAADARAKGLGGLVQGEPFPKREQAFTAWRCPEGCHPRHLTFFDSAPEQALCFHHHEARRAEQIEVIPAPDPEREIALRLRRVLDEIERQRRVSGGIMPPLVRLADEARASLDSEAPTGGSGMSDDDKIHDAGYAVSQDPPAGGSE